MPCWLGKARPVFFPELAQPRVAFPTPVSAENGVLGPRVRQWKRRKTRIPVLSGRSTRPWRLMPLHLHLRPHHAFRLVDVLPAQPEQLTLSQAKPKGGDNEGSNRCPVMAARR